MSRGSRALAAATTVAALSVTCFAGSAHAAERASVDDGAARVVPHIRGGVATNTPYMVKLVVGSAGGSYVCSGEAISAEWILTARHCTQGNTHGDVYFQDSPNRTLLAPIQADRFEASVINDVGLLHLSTPKPLTSYAKMTSGYTPKAGDAGTISGFGHRKGGAEADGLYTAKVTVLGAGKDLYGGTGIHIEGVDGSAQKGDSGGALVVNGRLVGLDSRGDYNDSGTGIHARSYWANITASRDWIRQVAGV